MQSSSNIKEVECFNKGWHEFQEAGNMDEEWVPNVQ